MVKACALSVFRRAWFAISCWLLQATLNSPQLAHHEENKCEPGRIVNPAVVEYLVGLPKGWTLECPLKGAHIRRLLKVRDGLKRRDTLDLFTGIGGLSLGLRHICRPLAYCELDIQAKAILAARMQDNLLERAPIMPDVRVLGLNTTKESQVH